MDTIRCDSQKCVGCHSCTIACAVEHSQSKDILIAPHETPKPMARRFVRIKKGKNKSVACQHCKKPACVKVCETGAMQKTENGMVICDAALCNACFECITACPFNAVIAGDGVPVKCDMCPERDGSYACIEACKTGALTASEKKAAAPSGA